MGVNYQGFKEATLTRHVGVVASWRQVERYDVVRHGQAVQQWNRWPHIHGWWIKIKRDTLGVSNPRPRPDHKTQGSSAGDKSP